jgi:hypothetical protein
VGADDDGAVGATGLRRGDEVAGLAELGRRTATRTTTGAVPCVSSYRSSPTGNDVPITGGVVASIEPNVPKSVVCRSSSPSVPSLKITTAS